MEKRKQTAERAVDWNRMLQTTLRGVAAAAVLFAVGLLTASALISRGIVPAAQLSVVLCVVYAAEAFGATAMIALVQKRQILAAGLLTQAVFLGILLIFGMLLYEAQVNWPQLAAAALAACLASAAAAALLSGKGKKRNNFKKNGHRRLKKK